MLPEVKFCWTKYAGFMIHYTIRVLPEWNNILTLGTLKTIMVFHRLDIIRMKSCRYGTSALLRLDQQTVTERVLWLPCWTGSAYGSCCFRLQSRHGLKRRWSNRCTGPVLRERIPGIWGWIVWLHFRQWRALGSSHQGTYLYRQSQCRFVRKVKLKYGFQVTYIMFIDSLFTPNRQLFSSVTPPTALKISDCQSKVLLFFLLLWPTI